MAQDTLTITDNRTNLTYNLPIEEETIRAVDLRQIKTGLFDCFLEGLILIPGAGLPNIEINGGSTGLAG